MYRELHEEVGLLVRSTSGSSAARATGCVTRFRSTGSSANGAAATAARSRSGILLRLTGRDNDVSLRATEHPEFDAWRWHDYWVPLESVIEFKREVYRRALIELERYLHSRPQTRRERLFGLAHPSVARVAVRPTAATPSTAD